jgi:hypothetical protein
MVEDRLEFEIFCLSITNSSFEQENNIMDEKKNKKKLLQLLFD